MKRVEIAHDALFTVYRKEIEGDDPFERLLDWVEDEARPEQPFDQWASAYLEHLCRWLNDLGAPAAPDPLSVPWWIKSLITRTEQAMQATDPSHRLHLAVDLGERRQAFKFHCAYLSHVERAAKDQSDRSAGGHATRKHNHEAIRDRARQLKLDHPKWGPGTIAAHLSKQLGIAKSSVADILASPKNSTGR